jgi:carboxypeptidase T
MNLLALLVLSQAATQGEPPKSLITVEPARSPVVLEELLRLDFDVTARRADGTLELIAGEDDRARLARLGVPYAVEHADLAAFYAARAAADGPAEASPRGSWLVPPFGQGSMGGYYTFAELLSVLDQIAAAYPSLVKPRASIGTSVEGRVLWALKISDNPQVDENEPELRFDSLHHAREPESMQALIWVMLALLEDYGSDPRATYLVDERETWLVPCVNPDGYVYNQTTNPGGGGLWRKNRRNNGNGSFGVDLNRNYDYQWGFDNVGSSPTPSSETYRGTAPASEPEIVAMQAFIGAHPFQTAITTHTYSDLFIYPWSYVVQPTENDSQYAELSVLATVVNGYTYGIGAQVLYIANGVLKDYDHGVRGTLCWTNEIGDSNDGFWPPPSRIVPLAQENEECFLRTALAAGAYLHETGLAFTDLGDGDGNFDPGETFEVVLTARNSGRLGASASVTLSSADPNVTLLASAASLGSVAPFANASNAGLPLSFSIAPGATPGAELAFTTTLSYQGFDQATLHEVRVGDPRAFLTDDLELDLGWTAGVPDDTATTGLWAFGDPVGTTNNGEPSNPELDATTGAGTRCFTTGNGSTSAGGDDVDNGKTTLISPALDLSGASSANLSYQRWWADFSTNDDLLQVSVSDDDGATWVSLEDVSVTQNAWTEVSFDVEDFVALTDRVRLRFVAADDPNNSVVEAAVDELRVEIYDAPPRLNLYGTPALGKTLATHVAGDAGKSFVVYASPGTATIQLPGVSGPILLDPVGLMKIGGGSIPASGLARVLATVPNEPSLVGQTFYLQAATVGGGVQMSNRSTLTFQ